LLNSLPNEGLVCLLKRNLPLLPKGKNPVS